MTQPEETTAALIARLHEELNASKAECLQWRKDIDEERTVRQTHEGRSQSLHRALAKERSAFEAAESARIAWAERCIAIEKERDEQRARAEKAEAELVQERLKSQTLLKCKNIWLDRCTKARKECDEFNASHAALDRLLAERTRERDEARACYGSVCGQLAEQKQSYARLLDLRDRLTRERDEAREQLGRVQADYQVFMLGTAHGAKCWADECGWHCAEGCKAKYARKCVAVAELKTAREQLAKLEWAGRSGWAKEPVCALYWGCRPTDKPSYGQEHYGHRPTCWFAKKEAGKEGAKPQTLREQWKTKQAHYDHWLDAVGYRLLDVDWAKGNSVTVTTNRPVQPGAAFVYDQPSGIWKLVDKPADEPARCSLCLEPDVTSKPHPHARCKDHDSSTKEPARPEPRFKVGEKVVHERGSGEICGMFWSQADGWQYQLRSEQPLGIGWPRESSLKPAPKFAVGEWVVFDRQAYEILGREFVEEFEPRWRYQIDLRMVPEQYLTAQTPQHKQCGAGYVFLGRMTNAIDTDWDLWFVKDGSPFVPGRALASDAGNEFHLASDGDKQTRPELVEARRRAVALGLVKP